MKNLLNKELRLATSPLAWIFLSATLMTFLPGYPILMGGFFLCMGLFQSSLAAREFNDTLYTVLLPVRKADAVKARYLAFCFFQMLGFLLSALFTALRMTLMADSPVYQSNALMNATPLFLAFLLLLYAIFNLVFLGGYFRSGYKIGPPFAAFAVVCVLYVGVAESLHFFPGLHALNEPAGAMMSLQWTALGAACVLYALLTLLSERRSERLFEKLDL